MLSAYWWKKSNSGVLSQVRVYICSNNPFKTDFVTYFVTDKRLFSVQIKVEYSLSIKDLRARAYASLTPSVTTGVVSGPPLSPESYSPLEKLMKLHDKNFFSLTRLLCSLPKKVP